MKKLLIYFSGSQKKEPFYIRGIISDRMIALLIRDERKKMKFIFHGGKKNGNINLLQLTADFNKKKYIIFLTMD